MLRVESTERKISPLAGEEEPPEIPVEQLQLLQEQNLGSNESAGTLKIKELPNVPKMKKELLFFLQPFTTAPFSYSPSNFFVNPCFFAGLRASEQEVVPSWFQNCNKELIDVAAFSEHEAFDHPVACNKQFGSFLSVDDIEELRNTMHDISSKHVIPHMELKIRVLHQQVSATRKGFRNQIKNLWWRKGNDDAPENPNGPMYTFSSTESQIQVLGVYAFMLRDYELALSNYRLISTYYKLDKAWKHYAGVQVLHFYPYPLLLSFSFNWLLISVHIDGLLLELV